MTGDPGSRRGVSHGSWWLNASVEWSASAGQSSKLLSPDPHVSSETQTSPVDASVYWSLVIRTGSSTKGFCFASQEAHLENQFWSESFGDISGLQLFSDESDQVLHLAHR